MAHPGGVTSIIPVTGTLNQAASPRRARCALPHICDTDTLPLDEGEGPLTAGGDWTT